MKAEIIRNIVITKAAEKNMVYVDYEYKARNNRWVKDYEFMTEKEAKKFVKKYAEA